MADKGRENGEASIPKTGMGRSLPGLSGLGLTCERIRANRNIITFSTSLTCVLGMSLFLRTQVASKTLTTD